ncbi:MAG: hypothetical protein ACJ72N_09930 [Labedaea sp.]
MSVTVNVSPVLLSARPGEVRERLIAVLIPDAVAQHEPMPPVPAPGATNAAADTPANTSSPPPAVYNLTIAD